MVEGGGSDNYSKVKSLALNDPAAMHKLLEVITDAVIAYLTAQRLAGAQALQVFDTWGGVLSPSMYREFSLRYLQRIAAELPRGDGAEHAPLILFGKGNDALPRGTRRQRRRRRRRRLDGRTGRRRAPHRRPGRDPGQPRSGHAVRATRRDPPRSRPRARRLRRRQRRFARRPRLQPRPRPVAGHEARARRRAGGGGARTQRALKRKARTKVPRTCMAAAG